MRGGLIGLLLALVLAVGAGGQGWGRRWAERPPRDIFSAGTFTFCRVEYSSRDRGGWGGRRGGWATDYPESDLNFSLRLSQLTALEVGRKDNGDFAHAVVRLDEPELFNFPFIYMIEVGGLVFSEAEREGLRSYLLRGGFLLVDDFWGDEGWENWQYEFEQVLPPEQFPMVDIPSDHDLFNIVFQLNGVPQVPAVNHYRQWEETGSTVEYRSGSYQRYGSAARCKGVFDRDGRLMAVILHNTDLGDGWEREGDNYGYFRDFSAKKAYPMGINIVVYAMTH